MVFSTRLGHAACCARREGLSGKNPARFVGISWFRFEECPLWLDVALLARR
jgi:hypothetical protein